jgi:hypothetical protein
MGVTAHYIIEALSHIKLQSCLIAFRYILGSHDGAVIGRHFLDILTGLGIEHKIGMITSDNASNNNTALVWIEAALEERGIPFSCLSNHGRLVVFCTSSYCD